MEKWFEISPEDKRPTKMEEMRETEVMIDRSRLCSSQVRSLRKFYMPIKVVVAENIMVKVDIAFKFKYKKLKWIQIQ